MFCTCRILRFSPRSLEAGKLRGLCYVADPFVPRGFLSGGCHVAGIFGATISTVEEVIESRAKVVLGHNGVVAPAKEAMTVRHTSAFRYPSTSYDAAPDSTVANTSITYQPSGALGDWGQEGRDGGGGGGGGGVSRQNSHGIFGGISESGSSRSTCGGFVLDLSHPVPNGGRE